jgi:AbrB family looped-hinge helix DNA binding protein
MEQYRVTMTEGGRIVIPAALRKMMNVRVGDEMTLGHSDGKVFLSTRMMALQRLRARIAEKSVSKKKGKKTSMVDALIAERRLEVKAEIAEAKRRVRS